MTRYARQMILPEIGETGQARLAASRVLVVGAGGLGCPVLTYLAAAGVGDITIYDPDLVEESNLHRQTLYHMTDLGQPKAHAARAQLMAANPGISLHAHVASLDPGNAPKAVENVDLVIDAADSFAVSYTLSDLCLRENKPLISASVLGQSGYVGAYCSMAPSLRAVFPDLPDHEASCASAGVMGPVVGMIGSMQAQMALQVLIGHDPTPLGRVLSVDARTWQTGGFSFGDAPEPDTYFPFLSHQDLAPQDQVIELRDEAEAPVLPTARARRMTPADLAAYAPDGQNRVVLCCSSGLRAWRAAARLHARGYRNLALFAARHGA